ncbi:hypothetical protein PSEUBRA_003208 [Kalmanozyma brasiliensis GHG001]|uniref:uncharacterized protein n=1 Tax=Kalmanozyma brasiliensis (strain GHG001) TaxID=1365824 RepID=UPI001CE9DA78|nr:uncharacterized protein PSEUBRA_003208 [Kalmanozyma brasiliensis GHG001]EST07386.2 hypothetical protein PSEUBRA_003208 [Kalmanozyma brasiliensis GHG001]
MNPYHAAASAQDDDSSSFSQLASNSSSDQDQSQGPGIGPLNPDVVANPWNTSLLWSSGILDNRDPRSTFSPSANWRNMSMPSNVDTAPISYYFSSSTAGDSVDFCFSGHGLSVLDYRGPTRGRYNLTVDNTTSVIIDAYSSTDELAKASGAELPPAIWTSETFDEGNHYVVMTNLNNVSDMNFWGVVINPNNYRPGKSFVSSGTNTKLIIIASSVTAVVMFGIFILIGSLIYYYKLVRPRRRLQAQIDTERKDAALLTRPSSSNVVTDSYGRSLSSSSSTRLRLDTNFLASQGDLGRAPSRITATTNESQFWVRSETDLALALDNRRSTRTPAVFQEIRLGSVRDSAASSPVDLSPTSDFDASSTMYNTELGQPLSPLSPTNPAYAPAQTLSNQASFWGAAPALQRQASTHQLPSHRHSNSLNSGSIGDHSAAQAARTADTSLQHVRAASTPDANPFKDPRSTMALSNLARTGSRRPLPTPPTAAASPVGPMPPQSPAVAGPPFPEAGQRHSTSIPEHPSASLGRSASQHYRFEQDACSFHLSDDGMVDDHTGETLLPPPYAPRDMGRHFR